MKKAISISPIILILLFACKKKADECWMVPDDRNFTLPWIKICGQTEDEIRATYSFYYYNANEPLFCWYLTQNNNQKFVQDHPESLVNSLFPNYTKTKVACDYCGWWYSRIKRTHKTTNNFLYTDIYNRLLCADTAKTMFQGRKIILKNTADSLVVQEISKDGIVW
jgi:hypothetical protein